MIIGERFAVRVSPGELHFNAAHFITFDGTCENLHGHNFHVLLEARGDNAPDAYVIDFVRLTHMAAGICRELHDGVLLAGDSPEVHLREEGDMVHVESYDKRFALPAASCIILPLPNTTAEMLAAHVANRLLEELATAEALANLHTLEVAVEEADDQWGVCIRELKRAG